MDSDQVGAAAKSGRIVAAGGSVHQMTAPPAAMIAAYDDFYEGQRAPLPAGVVPATDECGP